MIARTAARNARSFLRHSRRLSNECAAAPTLISPAPEQQDFVLTVRGGTVVLDGGKIVQADIGVDHDGRIAAIAPPYSLKPAVIVNEGASDVISDIDAAGLVVVPGGIDSHCHIEQRTSTGLTPCDDFYTASLAALCGGTTTIIPFACQHKGQRIRDAVEEYKRLASHRGPACDYAFHIIVSDPYVEHAVEDLEQAITVDGFTSIKVYMTYDALRLTDTQMLDVLAVCRKYGKLMQIQIQSYQRENFEYDFLVCLYRCSPDGSCRVTRACAVVRVIHCDMVIFSILV